jgi:ribonuclease D
MQSTANVSKTAPSRRIQMAGWCPGNPQTSSNPNSPIAEGSTVPNHAARMFVRSQISTIVPGQKVLAGHQRKQAANVANAAVRCQAWGSGRSPGRLLQLPCAIAPPRARRNRIPRQAFPRVHYDHITTDQDLEKFCRDLRDAERIAFDTEFVSEHTYRPQLCLIQVAAGDRLAVIDPQTIRDVSSFWKLLAAPGHETIVHAGREELLFCLGATAAAPHDLFDVQIAAGLIGFEYPAGYGSLLAKLMGQRLQKGETRTDWRRRPLSPGQIEYALDDVRHLEAMAAKLHSRLEQLGRTSWMDDEMAAWKRDVEATRSDERWWRVSGTTGLSRRSLAIVRELWRWREREAQQRDCPTRRVLRDDLIIELAKRRSPDAKQIRALRGMERGDLQRSMGSLAAAVERGLAVTDEDCPVPAQREGPAQLAILGQFLSSALGSICRAAELAPSIVGTAGDVRDLVAYRLDVADGNGHKEPPQLGRGWRAEVVGRLIDDLLAGKLAIRIRDPRSNEPLTFEPLS